MSNKAAPHSGHRARMKARVLQGEAAALQDHQLLEMLLYYSVRRRDTNELAHRLINHFGSLKNVLSASSQELTDFGLNERSAAVIGLAQAFCLRCTEEAALSDEVPLYCTVQDYRHLILPMFRQTTQTGKVLLVLTGSGGELLYKDFLSQDILTASVEICRCVARLCVSHKAACAVLACSEGVTETLNDHHVVPLLRQSLESIGLRVLHIYAVCDNQLRPLTETQTQP